MMEPNVRTFPVDGVTVIRDSPEHYCNRFMCRIQLHRLNIKSSGTYRCEVSGDAPEFKLAHGVYNMTVAGEYLLCIFGGTEYGVFSMKIDVVWG